MYFPKCYKRILFVATGSGIAPMIPWLQKKERHERQKIKKYTIYTLWMCPHPTRNFNPIVDLIKQDHRNVIFDTKRFGRPDFKTSP
eukprot:UN03397